MALGVLYTPGLGNKDNVDIFVDLLSVCCLRIFDVSRVMNYVILPATKVVIRVIQIYMSFIVFP